MDNNFYNDNKSLRFHLSNPMMEKIVGLREDNYKYANAESVPSFDEYAPQNLEDALDSYDKVLEIAGEICGEIIAPNAESVDAEGPELKDNRVHYAKGTVQNLKALADANLMGMTLPRKYGGLNFPTTVYSMAVEMISRADASLMNLFGLQDIGETVKEFADEEIRKEYLPRFASGEATGAMILTEPDAGSDLQAVDLKAHFDEKSGKWLLNGVKRFITNGNAELSLVLARSEEGTKDGRGLSMFLYERDDTVQIRRIEDKMGIHGSPTCEMVFKNSPCIIIGKRRMGLIKYVMSLMNGARLGIGAQSIGISEAAYREAYKYALEREQFGKTINKFPAVYEMLTNMRVKIEASRTLLYETSRFVDVYKSLEAKSEETTLTPEEKKELKAYQKRADFYTPLLKGISSEYCNQITYDAIQVHGGTGFMKDFPVERLYRDARITSIYEGTTQLQVVAAIRGVGSGFYLEMMKEYDKVNVKPEFDYQKGMLRKMTHEYEKSVKFVQDKNDTEYFDFHARRLVEMAGNIIMGYLLLQDADRDTYFKPIVELFVKRGNAENEDKMNYIHNSDPADLGKYKIFSV
ncbi:MAG: acyl-CoA dehydrogenase family protein [Candidatus Delongbacteria bacterium]|nr:acyl-CoA dehydrogenase family protein [Candidatus Delongbacteria bacterium]MBN2834827.1 acyl-CoA dehydrogenase family protein [Candidatus Delongbacteria bacterium]